MKIDKLIELLNVEEAIIIVNKKTIDSFFNDIEGISSESATFDMPIYMGARGICRNSTNVYFVDQEDLEDIKFKKNMKYTRTTTNDIIVNGHEILVKDSIVESVIEQFKQRSETGIKKYNTTLDRKDLSRLEWLQHLQEELFDASLYIEKLKTYERT